MAAFELIAFPAQRGLAQIIEEARNDLFVATPYMKDYGVGLLLGAPHAKKLHVLTNLHIANLAGPAFDIDALLKLWNRFDVSVSSLGNLHAKVYVADDRAAFITSANLTRGGLRDNYEYGVVLRDELLVSQMLADMSEYSNLGNIFNRETIAEFSCDVERIRGLQRDLDRSAGARHVRRALREAEDKLETKILTNRVQTKTVNGILAETIQYLLRTRGALTTQELHPLIQRTHPDICDDSVDRVINGQHFGKKWKHFVRNAQQYLKRSGRIELKGQEWHLRA